jgi:4-amino-4-deoxy-L-arabinose transferase-like glycosyltransferase
VSGLLLAGLLGRGTIAFWLPPGFDEAYYYLYTQHLDWSYFDHPPLVALTTGFGPWLTGAVSQWTIRFGSLLLHTGALLLLYLTGAHLFSQRAGWLTLAIASLIPIFLLGFGVLTLPDAPLMFFWTAALYIASREFFNSSEDYCPSYRLAIVGLLVGLACLSKYHGLALGFGLVGFCLTTPRYRSALRSPWMIVSLGLFLLAILPIGLWNVQQNWVSLRFQSGRAVPDRGYSSLDLLVTWLAGMAYLFPTFGLPLWGVSGRSLWLQWQSQIESTLRDSQRFILWASLPLMVGFTLMGGYRAILPTWATPGFWSATLLLGWVASRWSRRSVQRWLWGSGVAIGTLLLIALSHVTLGTLQRPSQFALFGGVLAAQADASVQLLDLGQLRQGLGTVLPQGDFLFTNDIYLAGQVGMAIAPLRSLPITCLDRDLRGFAFWSTASAWVGQTGLLVTPAARAPATIAQYQGYFQQIEKIAEIPLRRGGTIVQVLHVYQCGPLLRPYPRPYGR